MSRHCVIKLIIVFCAVVATLALAVHAFDPQRVEAGVLGGGPAYQVLHHAVRRRHGRTGDYE